jgi:uncharacterized delta-60 repeat protein
MKTYLRAVAACMALSFASYSFGAAGDLDTTFNGNGVVTTNYLANSPDRGQAVALDATGKVLVAGYTGSATNGRFIVTRYTVAGIPDTTFDADGITEANFTDNTGNGNVANSVGIDSMGRIIAAGNVNGRFANSEVGLARFLADGSLDPSFDSDGKFEFNVGAIDTAYDLAIDGSDRLVTVGNVDGSFLIARTTAAGALDATFGGTGTVAGPAGVGRGVAIDSIGRIVVAGYTNATSSANLVLARYLSDGSVDASFNGGSAVTFDLGGKEQAYAVTTDASDRIIVAGSTGLGATAQFLVLRFNTDGSIDTGFNTTGYIQVTVSAGADVAYDVTEDAAGNTIVVGSAGGNTGVVRLTSAGTLDPFFASSGILNIDLAATAAVAGQQDAGFGVKIDSSNRILVAGQIFIGTANNYDLSVARIDNSSAGIVEFSSPTFSISEAGPSASITATRVGGSQGAISVDYATADATATAGLDYTASSGTLNWADGDATSKSFNVPITDDTLNENSEDVDLSLSNPSGGAVLGAQNTAILTIVDNDPAPTLSIDDVSAAEGDVGTQNFTFTVSLSAASGLPVTVDFATNDGTATAGSDYTATNGTLNFAPGEISKTIDVVVQGDTLVELDEGFTVDLAMPSNASLLDGSGAGLIINDDAAGSIQFSAATYSVAENGVSATITATRTAGSDGAVSVDFATSDGSATAGSDYTATSGTLNWADGDAADKTFQVLITDDTTDEPDETVNLSLTNASGGATLGAQSTAVLTIVDNDVAGVVQLSTLSYSVQETDGSVAIVVSRSGGSNGAVSVDFATTDGTALAGLDYTANAGTLTWADGDVSDKTITVAIIDDLLPEPAETFSVVLSNPTGGLVLGAGSSATVTIEANDPAFVPVAQLPTLSQWALLMMALLMIGASVLTLNRRRQ